MWLRVRGDELDYENACFFYRGTLFTGTAIEVHANGVVATEDDLLFGSRHGWTRTWDDAGRLIHEGQIELGSIHGIQRTWHAGGRLASVEHCQFGVRLTYVAWDEHGVVVASESIDRRSRAYEEVGKGRARRARRPTC